MYSKKELVVFGAGGLVLLVVGIILGMLLTTFVGPQAEKIKAANNLLSRVVTSTSAYGQVKSIEGRNVTLENLGDELAVPVSDNATVFLYVAESANTTPVQEKSNFEGIQVGDSVNVKMELSANNKLEASYISILPRVEE